MKKLTRWITAAALGVMLSAGNLVAQPATSQPTTVVIIISNPDGSTTVIIIVSAAAAAE